MSSRREFSSTGLCRGLCWHQSPGCRALASPAHLLLTQRPRPKLKPNKGLKPTKDLCVCFLTPVQLWSLLWLYGRLVPKPGQELPAPYRYLGMPLPVRTPQRLGPTLGFLVYHRFKGWSERVPRHPAKATPIISLISSSQIFSSKCSSLLYLKVPGEKRKSLTGAQSQVKAKSTVSSPCNKERSAQKAAIN